MWKILNKEKIPSTLKTQVKRTLIIFILEHQKVITLQITEIFQLKKIMLRNAQVTVFMNTLELLYILELELLNA